MILHVTKCLFCRVFLRQRDAIAYLWLLSLQKICQGKKESNEIIHAIYGVLMHSKILASLGLIGTVISASAFAEPPIQPGDTLESLSQAKVTTTVNGQPGSIQELVSSGQIKLLDPNAAAISPAGQGVPNDQAVSQQHHRVKLLFNRPHLIPQRNNKSLRLQQSNIRWYQMQNSQHNKLKRR